MVNIDKNQDQYFPDQEKKHCYSSLTEKKQLETGISRHTLIILYKQISSIILSNDFKSEKCFIWTTMKFQITINPTACQIYQGIQSSNS